MGNKLKHMSILYSSKGTIYVVAGKQYLPCLPYEKEIGKTFKLKPGTVLRFLEIKPFGMDNDFMVMEVMESGDTVLLSMSCEEFLDKIPSRKNRYK